MCSLSEVLVHLPVVQQSEKRLERSGRVEILHQRDSEKKEGVQTKQCVCFVCQLFTYRAATAADILARTGITAGNDDVEVISSE